MLFNKISSQCKIFIYQTKLILRTSKISKIYDVSKISNTDSKTCSIVIQIEIIKSFGKSFRFPNLEDLISFVHS